MLTGKLSIEVNISPFLNKSTCVGDEMYHLCALTEIPFFSVHESCVHSCTTKKNQILGQICFHKWLLSMVLNYEDTFLSSEGY